MVRSEGGRHQAVTEALVAAIWTPPADSDRRPSNLVAYYELPYYDSATGAGRFVAFRSAQTVQLWVLDLCVYRDDGSAVHTVGQNVPPNVIPAWKRHHEKVTEIAEKALNKYRTVEELLGGKSVGGDKGDLILKRTPQSSNSNVFKGTVDTANGQLDFQFKRVGTLRQPEEQADQVLCLNLVALRHPIARGLLRGDPLPSHPSEAKGCRHTTNPAERPTAAGSR